MRKISIFLAGMVFCLAVSTAAFAETTSLMKAVNASEPKMEDINNAIATDGNVNAINNDGETALMIAAANNKNADVVAYLIKQGAAVNAIDDEGRTALMKAAYADAPIGIITALINVGADVNMVNNENETALMMACNKTNNPEVISTLVKAGADVTVKSTKEKTAWDYAQSNSSLKDTMAMQSLTNAVNKNVPTGTGVVNRMENAAERTGDSLERGVQSMENSVNRNIDKLETENVNTNR